MSEFNTLIRSETPVLVDFYAGWCAPCKMMAPILEQVASRVGDKARIIKVDIDKNPGATSAFGVYSVPTLILFRRGEILWRQSGVISADHLSSILLQHV